MSPILKPYEPQLGPKLLPNGPKLGPPWRQVGPKLEPMGPRANVAAISDRNNGFGRCWADLYNVQVTTLRPVPGEHATPPAEAAPLFERSGRITRC